MDSSSDNRTYSGWQREKGGAFFGLDRTQTMFVAAAAVIALVPLVAHSWAALAVAGPVTGVLVAAARCESRGGSRLNGYVRTPRPVWSA
jgi:hypothetical protein